MSKKIKIFLVIILAILIIISILFVINNIVMKNTYKKEYSDLVNFYATEYNVDPNLVYAIIKAESNFDEKAISNKNACGLMQLMFDTAVQVAKEIGIDINEETIYEPDININIGVKYISTLINKYNGNIPLALTAYNAGIGNVDNWISNDIIKADGSDIENIPFKETNNYVRKILRDYEIYKNI